MGWYGASYEISSLEFFDWIFNKKVCPKCGGKLKRQSVKRHIKKGWYDGRYGDHYKVRLFFKCTVCEKIWTREKLYK